MALGPYAALSCVEPLHRGDLRHALHFLNDPDLRDRWQAGPTDPVVRACWLRLRELDAQLRRDLLALLARGVE